MSEDKAIKVEGVSFENAPSKRRKVVRPATVAAPAATAPATTADAPATTATNEPPKETSPTAAEIDTGTTSAPATPVEPPTSVGATGDSTTAPAAKVSAAPAAAQSAMPEGETFILVPDTLATDPTDVRVIPKEQHKNPVASVESTSSPKAEAAAPTTITPTIAPAPSPTPEPKPAVTTTPAATPAAPPPPSQAASKPKAPASVEIDPSAYAPSIAAHDMPKFCMGCGGVVDPTRASCADCGNVHKPVSQVQRTTPVPPAVAPKPAATPVTPPKAHDVRTTSPTLLAPPDAVTQPVPAKVPSLPPAPPAPPPQATPAPAAPAPSVSALTVTTTVTADPAAANAGTGTLPPPAPDSWIRNHYKTLLVCVVVLLAILGAIYLARRGNGTPAAQVATNNTSNGAGTLPSLPHGPIPVVVQGPIQIQWPSIPDGGIPVSVQGMPTVAVGSLPPLPPVVVNLPSPPVVVTSADAGVMTQAATPDASSNTTDATPDSAAAPDAAVTPSVDNAQVPAADAGPTPALLPPPGMTCAAAAADAGTPACTAVPSREVAFYNGRMPFQLHTGWNCDATRPLDEPLRDGPNGYTTNVCAAACVYCQ